MRIFLLLLLVLLSSCAKDLESLLGIHEWKTYTIGAGNHFSDGFRVNTLSKDHLDFIAVFDETAIYELHNKNQDDINKLYGFTDCNSTVNENSARFGWRWLVKENKIEILAYIHKNGKIFFDNDKPIHMGYAKFGEEGSYSIYVVGDSYNFNYNGNLKNIKARGCNEQHAIRTILYPFFGGNETAPHTINIRIKQL